MLMPNNGSLDLEYTVDGKTKHFGEDFPCIHAIDSWLFDLLWLQKS